MSDVDADGNTDDNADDNAAPPGGRYEERSELGRGGMGQVLRVGDRDLGRDVAMKVVTGTQDPERLQRFLNEARITGQLEHPNIVPVHELGTDAQGRSYFTMKLIEGESLESVLARLEDAEPAAMAQYPLSRLLQIFLKVCDAVGFAHSRGVIHRDLKPENVMVGEFGEVLVVDWGLAKARGMAEAASPERAIELPADAAAGLTLEGDLMGTPAYMAPEQARGDHAAVDSRTDVFALGALLYALLTLRAPYEHDSTFAAIRAAQQRDLAPPAQRAPGRTVPPELASICLKAMGTDPVDRYEDAADLESDVTAYLEQRLVGAHQYSAGARAMRFLQRHPAGSLATAVGLVVLAVAGGIVGVLTSQREAADARAEVARVEAAAAQREAEISAARERDASTRADEAETSLDKIRTVAKLMRRARAELGSVAHELKQIAYAELPDADKVTRARALLQRVDAFGASVAPDDASQATWLGIRGWMQWSMRDSRRAFESFADAQARDPDVVSGRLFESMALLSQYMALEAFPAYQIRADRIEWNHIPQEGAAQTKLRVRLEALLKGVRTTKAWGETSAEELHRAFSALDAWYHGRLDEAVMGFGAAMAIPELDWLGDELLFIRARARIRTHDFDGAVADLQRTIAFDSLGASPMQYLAQAHQMHGLTIKFAGGDPSEAWAASIRLYEDTRRRFPSFKFISQPMALVRQFQAAWVQAHGGDPQPYLDAALTDLARAIDEGRAARHQFNTAVAFGTRHNLLRQRSAARAAAGQDPVPDARDALADMLEALAEFPTLFGYKVKRRGAVEFYARTLSSSGVRPLPIFGEWLDALAREAAAAPDDLRPVAMQAELYTALGRTQDALRLRERQLALYGRPTHDLTARIAALRSAAGAPAWRRLHDRGNGWMWFGDFIEGRRLLLAAIDALPEDPAPDPAAAAELHFHAARALAIGSAGQATLTPGADSQPLTAAESAALRARAVDELERAVALGFTDRKQVATDPVFRSLRGDPRYQALLRK